jgi:hypothetical protein
MFFTDTAFMAELFAWGRFLLKLYQREAVICFEEGIYLSTMILFIMLLWGSFLWFYFLSKRK